MTYKMFASLGAILICNFVAAPWISAQSTSTKSLGNVVEDKASKAEREIAESLSKLSDEDRKLAIAQRFCASMEYQRLGSMGTPLKLIVDGKPVFICCKGCGNDAKAKGKATLAKVEKLKKASAELAKLPSEERRKVDSQKYCAIAQGSLLGSMGAPIKLELEGVSVYLCCSGCIDKAKADPKMALAKARELIANGVSEH